MAARTRRRRRLALAGLGLLGASAFTLGAALGEEGAPRPRPAASRLTPAQLAGTRIVTGFDGARVPDRVARLIRGGRLGGVILFAGNLPSRAAAVRLTARLQGVRRPPGLRDPLPVMVDQEGGLVKRIGGAPSASAREMGSRGAAFSRRQGRRTAANLRDAGVNVDLAPVLDVARRGGVIAATDRGFGSSPARVSATANAFAQGLRAGGVAATAKHFPGMGAARENTDFAVQRLRLPRRELRRVDEAPYRRFERIGGDLVMLSSAIYPAFGDRPAAFSRAIATEELRRRLGFSGVTITDALGSVAVRDFGGPGKAARAAAAAGVDLLLFTDVDAAARASRALIAALRRGSLRRAAFEESAGRILRLRHRLGRSR